MKGFGFRLIVATMLFSVTMMDGGGADAAKRVTPTPDTFTVDGAEPHKLPKDAEKMIVHKVVDGDTVQLTYPNDDYYYVTRIIGINAPESVKPNSPVECFGPQASDRLKELLPIGSVVYVSRDVSDEDQYGRRLRNVWIRDADSGEAFLVSEILVRGGYADAREYRPDDEYDDELAAAERDAKQDDAGMWGTC
ncbi:MAG TPA: thermonuclease family protein [Thermomicrobiales bacterium]|nr:thermonuclease family protein [Thermomicrobiales bacterium]